MVHKKCWQILYYVEHFISQNNLRTEFQEKDGQLILIKPQSQHCHTTKEKFNSYLFLNNKYMYNLKLGLLSDAMLLFQHGPIFFIHHEVNQNSTRYVDHLPVSWVQHSHQHSVNWTTISCHKHCNTFLSFHDFYYPFKY